MQLHPLFSFSLPNFPCSFQNSSRKHLTPRSRTGQPALNGNTPLQKDIHSIPPEAQLLVISPLLWPNRDLCSAFTYQVLLSMKSARVLSTTMAQIKRSDG